MHSSLWLWIFNAFRRTNTYGDTLFDLELAQAAERSLRHPIPGINWNWDASAQALAQAFKDGKEAIYLVDFLVQHSSASSLLELKKILEESGSKWTVGDFGEKSAIVERLTPETEAEFESLTSGEVSTELLLRARSHIFGLNPNPPSSYHEAVKATEAALGHLIEPNNSQATLGTIRNVIRTQGWNFALEHKNHPELAATLDFLCSMLWRGQKDRHASQIEDFRDVTQQEAELAVSISLLLVQAASRGHLVRSK